MTLPEKIEKWVAENFTDGVDHELIRDDLIDVMAGNRPAACEFETKAIAAILNDH